jgi:hypothetical protein
MRIDVGVVKGMEKDLVRRLSSCVSVSRFDGGDYLLILRLER